MMKHSSGLRSSQRCVIAVAVSNGAASWPRLQCSSPVCASTHSGCERFVCEMPPAEEGFPNLPLLGFR